MPAATRPETDELTSASTISLTGSVRKTPVVGRGASALAWREEVVTRLFEAFSQDELEDALELLHPDVVFQPMTAEVTQAGEPYRGHEGIRRYVADVQARWQELVLAPTQIRVAGQAVVALGLVSGRGRAGAFTDAPTTWVFKFEDDLVVGVQIFSDARNVQEALVGASG